MKKILYIIAMALGLIACGREELPSTDRNTKPTLEQSTMTIIACTESNATKTSLSGSDATGYDVLWNEGDQIKIGSETFTLTEGAGTTKGTFSGNTLANGDYVAYYATSDGKVPVSQTYTAGKIGNFPMQADVKVKDGEASIANFTNIGGLLHLTIKKVKAATIKSIVLNVELNSSNSIMSLDCESSPVTLTETGSEFYIAMPAGTYTKFSIEMNTTDGKTLTKALSSGKSLVITRSQITNASFKTNSLNGHEFVNLGLPSTLLWATCNIGASTPDEAGTYFAWGETDRQDPYTFSWGTYKYGKSTISLTKYYSGDSKTKLDPDDDAAYQKWEGGWRMPTVAEYQELIDNCYWEWTESGLYDCAGWIVYKAKTDADKGKMCDSNETGKIEGYTLSDTHIFFPVSGRIFEGESEYTDDCYYWTSSLYSNYSYSAQNFAASNLNRLVDHYYRCAGEPIRAVCE